MIVRIITLLLWVAVSCLNGLFIYKLAAPFIPFRAKKWAKPILYVLLTGSAGMVIWVGDPNLAFTLLVFFPCFLLCTQGGTAPAAESGADFLLLYHGCLCHAGHLPDACGSL